MVNTDSEESSFENENHQAENLNHPILHQSHTYFFTAAQNPGYLHVKYLNLRKRRAQVFNCPSRKHRHQPINFTFRVGNVTVDMVNGEINIDKVCSGYSSTL